MVPDLINGAFELVGGVAVLFNIRAVLRDRRCAGFSVLPLLFFTAWGYWNLFYYPHLHQWWSTAGAASTVAANTAYLALVRRYR